MPTQLGKALKAHMKEVKCDLSEWSLSKGQGRNRVGQGKQAFCIHDKGTKEREKEH